MRTSSLLFECMPWRGGCETKVVEDSLMEATRPLSGCKGQW